MEWDHACVTRRYRLSGGTRLEVPKTPAQSLALYVRLRQLKTEFLRRQETRTDA